VSPKRGTACGYLCYCSDAIEITIDVFIPSLETTTVNGKPPTGTLVATNELVGASYLIHPGSAPPSAVVVTTFLPAATSAGKPKLKPLAAAVSLGTVTVTAPVTVAEAVLANVTTTPGLPVLRTVPVVATGAVAGTAALLVVLVSVADAEVVPSAMPVLPDAVVLVVVPAGAGTADWPLAASTLGKICTAGGGGGT